MKPLVLSLTIVLFSGLFNSTPAAIVYTNASTVQQLWIQDFQGIKFVYFNQNSPANPLLFFGFPLNHENAEYWLSQLLC